MDIITEYKNGIPVVAPEGRLAGDAELISISAWLKQKKPIKSSMAGIIFPVHMWGGLAI